MKKLRDILIFTAASLLAISCDTESIGGFAQDHPVLSGKVMDKDGNPVEHIMVTIDWGSMLLTPDVEYTDSDGRFMCGFRYGGTNDRPATVTITLEDIDGEANGGKFNTKTESMTIFKEDISKENGPIVPLTFHLTRATASENSPQS